MSPPPGLAFGVLFPSEFAFSPPLLATRASLHQLRLKFSAREKNLLLRHVTQETQFSSLARRSLQVNSLKLNLRTHWRIAMAFVVIYVPFLALLFSGDGAENWSTLLKLSPILPSIAIQALTGISHGARFLERWEFTALFTLLWVGGVTLGFLKLHRAFWPFAAATTLVTSIFVWIVLQLLRA